MAKRKPAKKVSAKRKRKPAIGRKRNFSDLLKLAPLAAEPFISNEPGQRVVTDPVTPSASRFRYSRVMV